MPAPLDRRLLTGSLAAIAIVVGAAYLLTLSPTLPTGDSGELIAAAWSTGVPHPPGYPLYMLLGHVALLLPVGEPAFRMNLLSALLDVAAVAMVYLAVSRLVARLGGDATTPGWLPPLAGAGAALGLAFSTQFWAYSLVAEVFALNDLIAAALLFVALEWWAEPRDIRLLYALGLLSGLGLADQQTILVLAPGVGLLALGGLARYGAEGTGRVTWVGGALHLVVAAGFLLIGLIPYVYLPVAARGDPPVNWGDPRTLADFLAVVLRSSYGTLNLAVQEQHGSIVEHLSLFAQYLLGAFSPLGCLFAVAGAWAMLRRSLLVGSALLLAFLFAGPVFLAFANVYLDSALTRGVVARFYILPSIPFAILVGAGIAWVATRALAISTGARPVGRVRPVIVPLLMVLTLASPAVVAAANGAAVDLAGDRVADHYGRDLLTTLEPHSLLLMRSDENYTSVIYEQVVEKVRPDVVALDVELLKLPSYVAQIGRQHPEIKIPWGSYDEGVTASLAQVIEENLPDRPVYSVGALNEDLSTTFDLLAAGLAQRYVPKGSSTGEYTFVLSRPEIVEDLHPPAGTYPDTSWEAVIAAHYGDALFQLAYALQSRGQAEDTAKVERLYRDAIRLAPDEAYAYKNLGLLLQSTGRTGAELKQLWTRFLALKPDDPDAAAIRAVVQAP